MRKNDDQGRRQCEEEKGSDDKRKWLKVMTIEEENLRGGSVHLAKCGSSTAEKLRPVVIELSDGD